MLSRRAAIFVHAESIPSWALLRYRALDISSDRKTDAKGVPGWEPARPPARHLTCSGGPATTERMMASCFNLVSWAHFPEQLRCKAQASLKRQERDREIEHCHGCGVALKAGPLSGTGKIPAKVPWSREATLSGLTCFPFLVSGADGCR